MKEIAIQCKGIKKTYGVGESRIEALKGIDIEVYKNELTLLVGPSGSGKTTLLSIITTILSPDEGQLFLVGKDMLMMNQREKALFCRDQLGIVFQSLFLIPTLSVLENIALPLIIAGESEKKANEKAMVLLEQRHLGNRAGTSPALLSKGQQQRVAIARAMVNDPKIIICDEPTSALDQTLGQEIMEVLHELALHTRAVLVVTHDHRIFSYADRIIHMNDGQITPGNQDE